MDHNPNTKRKMKPTNLIDIDKTDDERFIDYYRSVPPAKRELQKSIINYIPKAYGEKRTYPQNWSAHDSAKTNETQLFKILLDELLFLAGLNTYEHKKGRKGYSTRDKIFCMAIKVYSNSALRKTQSMLKELKNLNYIEKAPCFKSIDNFFMDSNIPNILDRLITLSSMPLIEFEKVAAIDSSGFALSKYERWLKYKWGKHEGKEQLWRKAHIICGCRTNIILSVKVSTKDVNDCPVFPILAKEAKIYYDMKEIAADKAYLSRDNLSFAWELGMIPFIPFKKNSKRKQKGCMIWGKMYKHFKENKDEFNKSYHARSNVETCFHMLKQRFGSNLTTKTILANAVELKLKVLCHNLLVLIQEFFELGIKVDFNDCVKMAIPCK